MRFVATASAFLFMGGGYIQMPILFRDNLDFQASF